MRENYYALMSNPKPLASIFYHKSSLDDVAINEQCIESQIIDRNVIILRCQPKQYI